MKRTHIIIISIYLFIICYFAVFNWDIFTIALNISLGFNVIRMPLLVILFVFGLVLLLVEWAVFKVFALKVERDVTQKETEINKLKAAHYDSGLDDLNRNFMSLKDLHHKINLIMEKQGIDIKGSIKTNHPSESDITTSVVQDEIE